MPCGSSIAPLESAAPTVRWALAQQNEDGGWSYGVAKNQLWQDAFHTGFNLKSLRVVRATAAAVGLDPDSIAPAAAITVA